MLTSVCMDAPWLDLDLSMYPSFLSAVYSYVSRQSWVKVLGEGIGTRIYMDNTRLCCSGPACSRDLLRGVSGAWCLNECRRDLHGSYLASMYPGLVVSAATQRSDQVLVSAAVILSRRTRYSTNVRRWMRIIFEGLARLDEDELRVAIRRAEKLPSPQPRQLSRVLLDLVRIIEESDDPWSTRRELLGLPGVGPKTSDAILLFTALTTRVAPCDVHLEELANNVLGLRGVKRPVKSECIKYLACTRCPLRSRCLSGYIVSLFRGAAGLVQTISYVYGRLGLRGWRKRLYEELEKYYR